MRQMVFVGPDGIGRYVRYATRESLKVFGLSKGQLAGMARFARSQPQPQTYVDILDCPGAGITGAWKRAHMSGETGVFRIPLSVLEASLEDDAAPVA